MNWKRIAPFVAILAILGLLIYFLWDGQERFNWEENYREENPDPYGTQVILGLLEEYYPGQPLAVIRDSISGALPEDEFISGNYVFIGEGLYMDSSDVQSLLAFVGSGNRALISSRTIPFDLMFFLYYEECGENYWDEYYETVDSSARLNFFHPDLHSDTGFVYPYLYRNEMALYRWQYIGEEFFCDNEYGLHPLGYLTYLGDSLVNFARVRYGDGEFYLHTTPLAFTNINLLEREQLEYANRVFSHLEEGPIYWDTYSRVSEAVAQRQNNPAGNRVLPRRSPLQYILQQPPLAWAWFLLLGAGLLYLLFRAKRRQRVIPVKDPNLNTSLEFVSTIGRLYFLQNNHRQLALQQMRLLNGYIREHYQLQTRDPDEDFAGRLAAKSEVPREVIDKILLLHRNIRNSKYITENTLIDFHKVIDRFYRSCK